MTIRGYTLVELMAVVAVISILSAIALPAYNNYSVRAKISELLLASGSYKLSVESKANTDGTLATAGVGLTVASSGRISGGSVATDGTITLIGNNATVGMDVTLVLTPTMNNGVLVWSCLGTPKDLMPANCR